MVFGFQKAAELKELRARVSRAQVPRPQAPRRGHLCYKAMIMRRHF